MKEDRGSNRHRCPASVGENVWQTVLRGQLRALQQIDADVEFVDVATKDSTAALAVIRLCFRSDSCSFSKCLGLRSSIPYSIVNQRQYTRSTTDFTQRKDRLPLFRINRFLSKIMPSPPEVLLEQYAQRLGSYIPRLLMLVAVVSGCCSNQIRQAHDTPESHARAIMTP